MSTHTVFLDLPGSRTLASRVMQVLLSKAVWPPKKQRSSLLNSPRTGVAEGGPEGEVGRNSGARFGRIDQPIWEVPSRLDDSVRLSPSTREPFPGGWTVRGIRPFPGSPEGVSALDWGCEQPGFENRRNQPSRPPWIRGAAVGTGSGARIVAASSSSPGAPRDDRLPQPARDRTRRAPENELRRRRVTPAAWPENP